MLNHDEEEVLKVLLKLYKEQNARDISGSFKNFPVKYQICYKEIISRLDSKKFVANFADFVAGDFVLTLMPGALCYFANKNGDFDKVQELEPVSDHDHKNKPDQPEKPATFTIPSVGINITVRLRELEKQAEIIGGEKKELLLGVIDSIRKIFENLKNNSVIKPDKELMNRISQLSADFPWLYGEIVYILGTLMMRILIG